MKTKLTLGTGALSALLLFTLNPQLSTAFAQGTAFTYQGRLNSGGSPFTGVAEFQPTLWDAASGGSQVATHNPASVSVAVTNGLFVLPLDFGAAPWTNGTARWLQLDVRTTLGPFTTLVPRQQLTATPFAITARNVTGVLPAEQLSGRIANATLPVSPSFSGAVTADSFSGNGVNVSNVNAGALNGLNAMNFWQTGGNSNTSPSVNYLGTADEQPLELHVNGRRALRLEPDSSSYDAPNVIGGSPVNSATSGVWGATIGGGGGRINNLVNSVTGNYGTVGGGSHNTAGNSGTVGGGDGNTAGYLATTGGGENNTASGSYTTVGGGENNRASGGDATVSGGDANTASGGLATVGGGVNNTAASGYTTVGGGYNNTASNNYATVGGGYVNKATNNYATVPGGLQNVAGGAHSLAAGQGAQALHDGAFVWSDGTASTASTGNNQFVVRASGGVIIYSPSGVPGIAWTSANGGSGSGLDADTLDGLHASSFLNTGNDYGRSGVAVDLYEGTTRLQDKYLNKTQPGTITANSPQQTLSVTNTGSGHGIYSVSSSSSDEIAALYGLSTGTSGNTKGVIGITYSPGSATGSSVGVYGLAQSSTAVGGSTFGVLGRTLSVPNSGASTSAGVFGWGDVPSGNTYGVWGQTRSSTDLVSGVYGVNVASSGMTRGVIGVVNSTTAGAAGVLGSAPNSGNNVRGVMGYCHSSSGYAVYSDGNFAVAPGYTKSAVVKTSQGDVKLYSQESPENWFEDFGEAEMVNGHVHVELDPLFLETVTINGQYPMKVFVQLNDDCNGVFVKREDTGFEVVELQQGKNTARFTYRVVAKRRGFEDDRLDRTE